MKNEHPGRWAPPRSVINQRLISRTCSGPRLPRGPRSQVGTCGASFEVGAAPRGSPWGCQGLLSDEIGVARCLKVKTLLQGGLGTGDSKSGVRFVENVNGADAGLALWTRGPSGGWGAGGCAVRVSWPLPGTLLRRGWTAPGHLGKARRCARHDGVCHRGGRPGGGPAVTSAPGMPRYGRSPGLVCGAAEIGVREVGPGVTWIPDSEAGFLRARPRFPSGH